MSNIFNYDAPNAARIYDRERYPMGADVIAGMLQVHCKKSLKDIHLLDAGCGTGHYTDALIKFGLGKVTMLDASAEMLEIAKEKLKVSISTRIVDKVVHWQLPTLPFDDGTFDAVMFNHVLQHLDRGDENKTFPKLEKALLATKRVLKPGGVLVTSNCPPVIIKQGLWFTQVSHDFMHKIVSFNPTAEEYLALFKRTGFRCVSAMNLLRSETPTIFKNYLDYEGPLKDGWCKGTNMFEVEDALLNRVKLCFNEKKEAGMLKQFMIDHDRTRDIGAVTLFVCISDHSAE